MRVTPKRKAIVLDIDKELTNCVSFEKYTKSVKPNRNFVQQTEIASVQNLC